MRFTIFHWYNKWQRCKNEKADMNNCATFALHCASENMCVRYHVVLIDPFCSFNYRKLYRQKSSKEPVWIISFLFCFTHARVVKKRWQECVLHLDVCVWGRTISLGGFYSSYLDVIYYVSPFFVMMGKIEKKPKWKRR